MMKDINENRYCNCQISTDKNILKPNVNHSFCDKCYSILIKNPDGTINYTLKPKQKQKPTEFNPIEIMKIMKKRTDQDYPYLNNEYNMSDIEKYNKERLLKSINIYLKNRKMIILTLQKMMKMLDYSDLIFYQCLFYIDTYLSHNMNEEMSEKKILYYLVGYFLISAKLKETDIYEPSLDSFCCLKKKVYLSEEKILLYEVICLQSIKYNIFSYSAYDWISELISIGFVFDCEINKNNSIILIDDHRHSLLNTISKYAMKMLLNITVKNIFIKFSPMHIAFSLIQIAREKYLDKNNINPKLFNNLLNLYGVNFNDYKKCYKELKLEIEEKDIEANGITEKEKNAEKENKNENKDKNKDKDKDNFDFQKLKKGSIDNSSENKCKMDKTVVVSNKIKSSLTLMHINKDLIKPEDKKNESENENKDDNNIIIYDENNEEKNNNKNEIENQLKLNLNEDEDTDRNKKDDKNNKLKSSHDLAHIKIKDKNHLFINCNSNAYKSNDNLPKINLLFDQSLNNSINRTIQKKDKDGPKNLKFSSSKEVKTNLFLKTNQKTLNPIKNKKIASSIDNKRYFQSNFNENNNNDNPKGFLDTMRKSLFCDNTNKNKKNTKDPAIGIFNRNYSKMKSTTIMPKISKLENMKEDIKDIKKDENKNNNSDNDNDNNNDKDNNNNSKKRCKSKSKFQTHIGGKETKKVIAYKRNQSINNNKKKTTKSTIDVNNLNSDRINLKWKNN